MIDQPEFNFARSEIQLLSHAAQVHLVDVHIYVVFVLDSLLLWKVIDYDNLDQFSDCKLVKLK
jgi:hypothetical protein